MDDLVQLLKDHAWAPAGAVAINLGIRMLKNGQLDSWLSLYGLRAFDKRWLPWVSVGAGVALGVLEKQTTSATWTSAIVDGLFAGVGAVFGHQAITEALMGGKEASKGSDNAVKKV